MARAGHQRGQCLLTVQSPSQDSWGVWAKGLPWHQNLSVRGTGVVERGDRPPQLGHRGDTSELLRTVTLDSEGTFSKLEPENLSESNLSPSDGEAPILPLPLPLPQLDSSLGPRR